MAAGLLLTGVPDLAAQVQPDTRQRRTHIPSEQLVTFSSDTPLDQFIAALNPLANRVMGKTIVDPAGRTEPIGVPIASMYFLDALETVLANHGLTYRQTDKHLIIETADQDGPTRTRTPSSDTPSQESEEPLASARTREVEINAMFFEVNLTKARELGINWSEVFGGQGGGGATGGGSGGGGSQTGGGSGLGFQMKTDQFINHIEEYVVGPDQIAFGTLTRIFRLFERENIGETIANPSVTVQSGEEGQIQIGSDIPIQIRDFAGNTTTQFVETGVIVDVTPTLMTDTVRTDTAGTEQVKFIHLDVQVEKSSGSPTPSGVVISKSEAQTQALLLDNEQTVIGGLYSTEKSKNRKGIPLLKDLPKWFFGLRYIFGYTQTQVTRKELLIVLQADLKAPLAVRARRDSPVDLQRRERQEFLDRIGRAGKNVDRFKEDYRLPAPEMPPPQDED